MDAVVFDRDRDSVDADVTIDCLCTVAGVGVSAVSLDASSLTRSLWGMTWDGGSDGFSENRCGSLLMRYR
jgi:hypothetical protein